MGRAHRAQRRDARRVRHGPRAQPRPSSSRRCATSTRPTRTSCSPIARDTSGSSPPRWSRYAARTTWRWGGSPVPGWDAKYDWQGFIPFEKHARAHRSPERAHRHGQPEMTPPGYKPFISVDWFPPYRAHRIEELLASKPRSIRSRTFEAMQADTPLAPRAGAAARGPCGEARHRRGTQGAGIARGMEGRHGHAFEGAARLRGLVPRAHAPGLRRRAGRRSSAIRGTSGRPS